MRQRALARSKGNGQRSAAGAWHAVPLLFCSLFLFSCSSRESDVKGDLTQYMNKARLWAAVEAQINNAISNVRRDQFVHDDFISETLKPVIGVAQQYVQQLENYQPRTPVLYNVHQEYIEAWRAHYFAMATLVDAVEKKDYIQLAKANNDLLEAQRAVSDALADLARLLREAGIQSESPADQPPASPEEGFPVSPS